MIWTNDAEDATRLREVIRAVQARGGTAPDPDYTCTDEVPVEWESDDDMSWAQPMD